DVQATYFLLLHSEFYNLLEKDASHCAREIIRNGHNIGLHFDASYYAITSEEQLEKHLRREQALLEDLFEVRIRSFSFHITDPFTMSCMRQSYAGLLNCYSDFFQKEVTYCSDSNGYWRFKRLEDVLKDNPKKLQVLTHPALWQDKSMSPRERVWRCIDGRAEKTRNWYNKVLKDSVRDNVGPEDVI
ncbi:MAG: hypothetical protein AABZ55_06990, partial [Bdellovibrionota bacterium]